MHIYGREWTPSKHVFKKQTFLRSRIVWPQESNLFWHHLFSWKKNARPFWTSVLLCLTDLPCIRKSNFKMDSTRGQYVIAIWFALYKLYKTQVSPAGVHGNYIYGWTVMLTFISCREWGASRDFRSMTWCNWPTFYLIIVGQKSCSLCAVAAEPFWVTHWPL